MNLRLRVRPALVVAQTPLIGLLVCTHAWAQTPIDAAPATSNDASATTATTAAAETPPAATSTEFTSSPTLEQRGPIHVTVTLAGYDIVGDVIASTIARDLGLSLTPNAALAQCRFLVEVERGKNLSLTFYGNNGLELKRVVKAPEASADVGEIAALLAVNLVRDEAPQLLPLLEQKQEEQARPVRPATPPIVPTPQPPARATPPVELPFIPANASLVFPLTIMRDVDERRLGFELGLVYSDVGAIDGAGISAAVLRTRNPSRGLLIASAVTIVGQPSDSAATGPALSGAQISGAVSLAGGRVDGIQISGAASVASGDVDGAQISGAANVAHNFDGFQTSGGLNVASGNVDGAQISGGVNVAKDVDGAQISLVNIGKSVDGAQIGLVNIGGHVQGAQIGLVNIAEEVDGASVGIITYSKKGQTQISTWFDSTRPINIGVRFVSGPLYALPSVGADPRNTEGFDFSLGLGARIPVQRFYVDVEGNSRMSFDDGAVREDEIDLRYRLTTGFKLTSWLGVFAGGGVHHYFNTNDADNQHFKPFWCAGVDLL